ncbi:hypothetical protein AURDEDRAFT_130075 [Auricularia subglabra TFB-10046 SS5]|uniref:Uncharacterized protein n=1 Tax=Auricularia subglabra (strain TFB-10046 / SS5) TaxID=717982 RepID=J0LG27_AURST|nr:hypothetical protein AURDEDRAFT_130075 [Auricularia subglabra TFB-10046 SS5]
MGGGGGGGGGEEKVPSLKLAQRCGLSQSWLKRETTHVTPTPNSTISTRVTFNTTTIRTRQAWRSLSSGQRTERLWRMADATAATGPDHVRCAACGDSSTGPRAFLLDCCASCATPALSEAALLARISATHAKKTMGTIHDCRCHNCVARQQLAQLERRRQQDEIIVISSEKDEQPARGKSPPPPPAPVWKKSVLDAVKGQRAAAATVEPRRVLVARRAQSLQAPLSPPPSRTPSQTLPDIDFARLERKRSRSASGGSLKGRPAKRPKHDRKQGSDSSTSVGIAQEPTPGTRQHSAMPVDRQQVTDSSVEVTGRAQGTKSPPAFPRREPSSGPRQHSPMAVHRRQELASPGLRQHSPMAVDDDPEPAAGHEPSPAADDAFDMPPEMMKSGCEEDEPIVKDEPSTQAARDVVREASAPKPVPRQEKNATAKRVPAGVDVVDLTLDSDDEPAPAPPKLAPAAPPSRPHLANPTPPASKSAPPPPKPGASGAASAENAKAHLHKDFGADAGPSKQRNEPNGVPHGDRNEGGRSDDGPGRTMPPPPPPPPAARPAPPAAAPPAARPLPPPQPSYERTVSLPPIAFLQSESQGSTPSPSAAAVVSASQPALQSARHDEDQDELDDDDDDDDDDDAFFRRRSGPFVTPKKSSPSKPKKPGKFTETYESPGARAEREKVQQHILAFQRARGMDAAKDLPAPSPGSAPAPAFATAVAPAPAPAPAPARRPGRPKKDTSHIPPPSPPPPPPPPIDSHSRLEQVNAAIHEYDDWMAAETADATSTPSAAARPVAPSADAPSTPPPVLSKAALWGAAATSNNPSPFPSKVAMWAAAATSNHSPIPPKRTASTVLSASSKNAAQPVASSSKEMLPPARAGSQTAGFTVPRLKKPAPLAAAPPPVSALPPVPGPPRVPAPAPGAAQSSDHEPSRTQADDQRRRDKAEHEFMYARFILNHYDGAGPPPHDERLWRRARKRIQTRKDALRVVEEWERKNGCGTRALDESVVETSVFEEMELPTLPFDDLEEEEEEARPRTFLMDASLNGSSPARRQTWSA